MIPFLDLKKQYALIQSEVEPKIIEILRSGNYILGTEVEACEKELAKYTGSPHALAVSNGTIALQMALQALDVGPGDEVIVPSFSFFATAEVVSTLGALPIFIDIDSATFNMNPNLLEKAISPKTRAIIPVSLFGQTSDMDVINQIALKHGVSVIEDAAQSFGASYKERKSCNLSDIGTTSFFPAKPLGCAGDGGAVFTANPDLAKKLESIRVHGQTRRYYHEYIGVNGRLDPIQCVIIRAKLRFHDQMITKRQQIAKIYDEAFEGLSEIKTPFIAADRKSAFGQYTLLIKKRDQFAKYLQEQGVPTAIHYPMGMHEQPIYQKMGYKLPVTEMVSQEVISLPLYPDMPLDHVQLVTDAVKKAVVAIF